MPKTDRHCYQLFAALFDAANMKDDCPQGEVALPDGTVIGDLVLGGFNPVGEFEERCKAGKPAPCGADHW